MPCCVFGAPCYLMICCEQESPAGPQGNLFFGRGFAVDPGYGHHLSHKINHSRQHANVCAIALPMRGDVRGIQLVAARVRSLRVRQHACVQRSMPALCRVLSHPCSLRNACDAGNCCWGTDFVQLGRPAGSCNAFTSLVGQVM